MGKDKVEKAGVNGNAVIFWVAIFFLGGLGLFLMNNNSHLVQKFGDALVIAALLAGLVDPFLKKSLAREISEDVFRYVIGHNVPPPIVSAVKEMLRIPVVRSNFQVTFALETGNKIYHEIPLVKLTITADYVLQNVTEHARNFEFRSRVGKGEWGIESEIKEVTFGETTWKDSDLQSNCEFNGEFLQFKRSVNIGPQAPEEARTVHTVRTLYLPETYSHVLDLLEPVSSLKLVFKDNTDFDWSHSCEQPSWISKSAGGTEGESWVGYDGVQLAGQHVIVRWTGKRTTASGENGSQ